MDAVAGSARGAGRELRRSTVLKVCIFATGLAGIVAEYVMATLASYLLGDAILQWTLLISLMLFAMGLGSRSSRLIQRNLVDAFITAELVLSVLVAVSAPLAFLLASRVESAGLVIYLLALGIGWMIGLELPLATRINEAFEELRDNVSSVFEKDYYGALLGGLLFAFVALPHLGLTYTPIALGAVNFLVAVGFFWISQDSVVHRRRLTLAALAVAVFLVTLAVVAPPIVRFGEQQKYRDVVVYTEQSRYQRIVITRWRDHHWLYLDGSEQFSSFDEERYHEPLVHPAMSLAPSRQQVLILGGGDGLAAREVLQYQDVERITLVDLDPAMTRLGREHPVLVALNRGALDHPKLTLVHRDAYAYLETSDALYNVILIDLPDPRSISLARLYSAPFYRLVRQHLEPGGIMVTQATSPFFSREAFVSIAKTVAAADLVAVPYHNHIPTLGEWGWVLGVRPTGVRPTGVRPTGVRPTDPADELRRALSELRFANLETRFLNPDAMLSMLHFGKGIFDNMDQIPVTELSNLAVYHLYLAGRWDLY